MKNPESNSLIKVAIADDHALFRTGVKTSLSSRKDIQMVAEAENGMQLLNLLRHIQPDVVLLDIQMPIMDGLTMLEKLRQEGEYGKQVPVIMLTNLSAGNENIIKKVAETSPISYIVKSSVSPQQIADKVKEYLR